ncbi:MAG: hypothetical protein H3C47_15395 [Candidatus Cloacimonetes bacterium]|nr:hypothetical protein [Candidatus Cloacimonadota bacterium]
MRIAMLSFLILIGHISAQVYRGNTLLINTQRVDTGLILRLRDSGFLRIIDPVGTIEVSSKNPVTGIVNFLPKDDRFWSWRWQIRSLIGLKLSLDTVSSTHFTHLKDYLFKQKQWYQEKIQGFSLDLRSLSQEGALQFLEGIDSDFDSGLGEIVLVMPGFSLVSISEDQFSRLSRKNLLIVDVTGMDEDLIQNLSQRLNQADFTFQLLMNTNPDLRTKSGIKVESPLALSHHPFRVHRVISASETLQYELIPRKPLVDSVLGNLGIQMFLYTRFSEEFIENRYKTLLKLPQKGLSGVAVESSGAGLRTLLPGYKTKEPRVHLTQNQKSVWLEISSEAETLEFFGSCHVVLLGTPKAISSVQPVAGVELEQLDFDVIRLWPKKCERGTKLPVAELGINANLRGCAFVHTVFNHKAQGNCVPETNRWDLAHTYMQAPFLKAF